MNVNMMAMVLAGAVLASMPATALAQSSAAGAGKEATPARIEAPSFSYARLGYGGLFGDRTYGMPGFGLGYRAPLNNLALDISFLNIHLYSDNSDSSNERAATSLIKLEVLRYMRPEAARSVYAGGGLSLASASVRTPGPATRMVPLHGGNPKAAEDCRPS